MPIMVWFGTPSVHPSLHPVPSIHHLYLIWKSWGGPELKVDTLDRLPVDHMAGVQWETTIYINIHTDDLKSPINSTSISMSGLWEEAETRGENPHRHGENMQTHIKTLLAAHWCIQEQHICNLHLFMQTVSWFNNTYLLFQGSRIEVCFVIGVWTYLYFCLHGYTAELLSPCTAG